MLASLASKLDTGNAVCADCAVGTFKNFSGPGACAKCPSGASSPAGSNALTACTCQPGFAGVVGRPPCTACAAGKFQNGSGLCVPCNTTSCRIGQYRQSCLEVARSSDAVCNNCTAVENAVFISDVDKSSNCTWQCAAGFQKNCRTNACEICNAAEFNGRTQEIGKTTWVLSCETCPAGAECDGSEVVVCRDAYYLAREDIKILRNNTKYIQESQECRQCPEGMNMYTRIYIYVYIYAEKI